MTGALRQLASTAQNCKELNSQVVSGLQEALGLLRVAIEATHTEIQFVIHGIEPTGAAELQTVLFAELLPTGVRLETQPAVSALQSFSALTRLDLTRCGVAAAGISVIAATVPSLRELNLSENGVLRSFTELRTLQQLSQLTRLDLSSPSTAMRMPESEHTAVCELTQLRHLALNSVMLTRRYAWSPQGCSMLCLTLTVAQSLCLSHSLSMLQS
jgi:Leucine-rich repeat (LRR) protein